MYVIAAFATALALPVFGGAIFCRRRSWFVWVGLAAAAVWWVLAYLDNLGSNDLTNTKAGLIAATGVFALIYFALWMLGFALGVGVSGLTRSWRGR